MRKQAKKKQQRKEARKRQRAGVEDAKQNLMGRTREFDAILPSLSSIAHHCARR